MMECTKVAIATLRVLCGSSYECGAGGGGVTHRAPTPFYS